MVSLVRHLVLQSLSATSQEAYRKAWEAYEVFAKKHTQAYDSITPASLMMYMAHQSQQGKKPSTIIPSVSAIRYMAKLKGYDDPYDHLVKLALTGLAKQQVDCDARMPITLPILKKLISVVPALTGSTLSTPLYQAMMALSFFAMLRIGEMTTTATRQHGSKPMGLQFSDVNFQPDGKSVTVRFFFYKHSTGNRPFVLNIGNQSDPKICPVRLIRKYFCLRGKAPGPLFLGRDGNPVTPNQFRTFLKSALMTIKLDPSVYKPHSFRIGAASWCSHLGYSDQEIRQMGRWKSMAFTKYIRNTAISV